MKIELTADYVWALTHIADVFQKFGVKATGTFVTDRGLALRNTLERLFPNAVWLLCGWHISKNILARQKRAFETNEAWEGFLKQWHCLVHQETIASYEEQLTAMQREFANYPQVMRYVDRVEGAHAALKRWISSSTGYLNTVDNAVKLACDNQLAGIVQKHAKQRAVADMQFGPLFCQVIGKISEESLRQTHRHYTQRYIDGNCDDDRVACAKLLTSTIGHPCRHFMLGRTEPLAVDDFDQHWYLVQPDLLVEAANILPNIEDALNRLRNQYAIADNHNKRVLLHHILDVPTVTVQEPESVQARGRPSGSTRRNPSHFEHVENAENASQRRRCRNCKQVGHNSRTCANQTRTPPA
ncbi:unnamed protein product [Trifolium pratense]|uniref:Uncharacterized protein n=1 Tax=Trifolium pratense TaxID=57577 RepID=A0ACB0K6S4_TRIPR|nr:unnamed protein product [Trifolium pratense]